MANDETLNAQVTARHYERIKNKEMGENPSRTQVEGLRKALSSRVNEINRAPFKNMNERHHQELNRLNQAIGNQNLNAGRANRDDAAPEVDQRTLNEQHQTMSQALNNRHASELIQFRDTTLSSKGAFNRASGADRSVDRAPAGPERNPER